MHRNLLDQPITRDYTNGFTKLHVDHIHWPTLINHLHHILKKTQYKFTRDDLPWTKPWWLHLITPFFSKCKSYPSTIASVPLMWGSPVHHFLNDPYFPLKQRNNIGDSPVLQDTTCDSRRFFIKVPANYSLVSLNKSQPHCHTSGTTYK